MDRSRQQACGQSPRLPLIPGVLRAWLIILAFAGTSFLSGLSIVSSGRAQDQNTNSTASSDRRFDTTPRSTGARSTGTRSTGSRPASAKPNSSKTIPYLPPQLQSPNQRQTKRQVAPLRTADVDSEPPITGPRLSAPTNAPLDFEAERQITDGYSDDPNQADSISPDSMPLDENAPPFEPVPRIGPKPLEPAETWDESEGGSDNYPLEQNPAAVPQPLLPYGQSAPPQPTPDGGPSGIFGRRKAPMPPNYWIISSRDCPQDKSPYEADRCTKYYYRGPTGKVEIKTAADFHQSLNPAIPVCFMVHGSLIEWDQNILEGHATYEWFKRAAPNTPFQMVLFTWPSERTPLLPPIDFSVLGYRSSYNGLYLARVLSRMPPSTSVSLVGHSHGARLVVSALHLLGGGESYGYRLANKHQPHPRIRTVLAAAALDHHWLRPGQRYGKALNGTESLLNLRNQTDVPLMLYPFPMLLGHDSLGRGGFTWFDQYRLGADFQKVRNVEVTLMLGWFHIWPRFHDHPEIAEKLAPYLFFQNDVPASSMVTRRWGPKPAAEPRAPVLVHSGTPRPASGGRSTLVNSASQPPARAAVDREIEIPLEPGRASLKSPHLKPASRNSNRRFHVE